MSCPTGEKRSEQDLFTAEAMMPDAADMETDELLSEIGNRLRAVNNTILEEAAVRFARGDYAETLWCLEKALGPAFAGLGDLTLGKP